MRWVFKLVVEILHFYTNFKNISEPNGHQCDTVGPVPRDVRLQYDLDQFYQRYTHAYGIPILSSYKVRDDTLKRACYIVRFMLADREDLR